MILIRQISMNMYFNCTKRDDKYSYVYDKDFQKMETDDRMID